MMLLPVVIYVWVKCRRGAFNPPKTSKRINDGRLTRRLPVVDVVVLPSPPPVLVGEAVDLQELFFAQTRDSSKVSGIGQSEGKEEEKEDIGERNWPVQMRY